MKTSPRSNRGNHSVSRRHHHKHKTHKRPSKTYVNTSTISLPSQGISISPTCTRSLPDNHTASLQYHVNCLSSTPLPSLLPKRHFFSINTPHSSHKPHQILLKLPNLITASHLSGTTITPLNIYTITKRTKSSSKYTAFDPHFTRKDDYRRKPQKTVKSERHVKKFETKFNTGLEVVNRGSGTSARNLKKTGNNDNTRNFISNLSFLLKCVVKCYETERLRAEKRISMMIMNENPQDDEKPDLEDDQKTDNEALFGLKYFHEAEIVIDDNNGDDTIHNVDDNNDNAGSITNDTNYNDDELKKKQRDITIKSQQSSALRELTKGIAGFMSSSTLSSALDSFNTSSHFSYDLDRSTTIQGTLDLIHRQREFYKGIERYLLDSFNMTRLEDLPLSALEILYTLRVLLLVHPTPQQCAGLVSTALRMTDTSLAGVALKSLETIFSSHSGVCNPEQLIKARKDAGYTDLYGKDANDINMIKAKQEDSLKRIKSSDPVLYNTIKESMNDDNNGDDSDNDDNYNTTKKNKKKVKQYDPNHKEHITDISMLLTDTTPIKQLPRDSIDRRRYLLGSGVSLDTSYHPHANPFLQLDQYCAKIIQETTSFKPYIPQAPIPTLYHIIKQTAQLSITFTVHLLDHLFPTKTTKLPLQLVEYVLHQTISKYHARNPDKPHEAGVETGNNNPLQKATTVVSSSGSLGIARPLKHMPAEELMAIVHIIHSLHLRDQPIPQSINMSVLIDFATQNNDHDTAVKLFHMALCNTYTLANQASYAINKMGKKNSNTQIISPQSLGISQKEFEIQQHYQYLTPPHEVINKFIPNFENIYGSSMSDDFLMSKSGKNNVKLDDSRDNDQKTVSLNQLEAPSECYDEPLALVRKIHAQSKQSIENERETTAERAKRLMKHYIPTIGGLNASILNSFARAMIFAGYTDIAIGVLKAMLKNIEVSIELHNLPQHTVLNLPHSHALYEEKYEKPLDKNQKDSVSYQNEEYHDYYAYFRDKYLPSTISRQSIFDNDNDMAAFKEMLVVENHSYQKNNKNDQSNELLLPAGGDLTRSLLHNTAPSYLGRKLYTPDNHKKFHKFKEIETKLALQMSKDQEQSSQQQHSQLIATLTLLAPNADTYTLIMSGLQQKGKWREILSLFFSLDQGHTNIFSPSSIPIDNQHVACLSTAHYHTHNLHQDGLLYHIGDFYKTRELNALYSQYRDDLLNNTSKNENQLLISSEMKTLLQENDSINAIFNSLSLHQQEQRQKNQRNITNHAQDMANMSALYKLQQNQKFRLSIPKNLAMLSLLSESCQKLNLVTMSAAVHDISHQMIARERQIAVIDALLGYLTLYLDQDNEQKFELLKNRPNNVANIDDGDVILSDNDQDNSDISDDEIVQDNMTPKIDNLTRLFTTVTESSKKVPKNPKELKEQYKNNRKLLERYSSLILAQYHNNLREISTKPVFHVAPQSLLQDMVFPHAYRTYIDELSLLQVDQNDNENDAHGGQPTQMRSVYSHLLLGTSPHLHDSNEHHNKTTLASYLEKRSQQSEIESILYNVYRNEYATQSSSTRITFPTQPIQLQMNSTEQQLIEATNIDDNNHNNNIKVTQNDLVFRQRIDGTLPPARKQYIIDNYRRKKLSQQSIKSMLLQYNNNTNFSLDTTLLSHLYEYQQLQPILMVLVNQTNSNIGSAETDALSSYTPIESIVKDILKGLPSLTQLLDSNKTYLSQVLAPLSSTAKISSTTTTIRPKKTEYARVPASQPITGTNYLFTDIFGEITTRLKHFLLFGQRTFDNDKNNGFMFTNTQKIYTIGGNLIDMKHSLTYELQHELKLREVQENELLQKKLKQSLELSTTERVLDLMEKESRLRYPFLPDSQRGVGAGLSGGTAFMMKNASDYEKYFRVLKKITPQQAGSDHNTPVKAMYNKLIPKSVLKNLAYQYVYQTEQMHKPSSHYRSTETLLDIHGIFITHHTLNALKYTNQHKVTFKKSKNHSTTNDEIQQKKTIFSSLRNVHTLNDIFVSNYSALWKQFYYKQPKELSNLEKLELFHQDLCMHFSPSTIHRVLMYQLTSSYLTAYHCAKMGDLGVITRLKNADRLLCQNPAILAISYDVDSKAIFHAGLPLRSKPVISEFTEGVGNVVEGQKNLFTGSKRHGNPENNENFMHLNTITTILVPQTPLQDYGVPLTLHSMAFHHNNLYHPDDVQLVERDYVIQNAENNAENTEQLSRKPQTKLKNTIGNDNDNYDDDEYTDSDDEFFNMLDINQSDTSPNQPKTDAAKKIKHHKRVKNDQFKDLLNPHQIPVALKASLLQANRFVSHIFKQRAHVYEHSILQISHIMNSSKSLQKHYNANKVGLLDPQLISRFQEEDKVKKEFQRQSASNVDEDGKNSKKLRQYGVREKISTHTEVARAAYKQWLAQGSTNLTHKKFSHVADDENEDDYDESTEIIANNHQLMMKMCELVLNMRVYAAVFKFLVENHYEVSFNHTIDHNTTMIDQLMTKIGISNGPMGQLLLDQSNKMFSQVADGIIGDTSANNEFKDVLGPVANSVMKRLQEGTLIKKDSDKLVKFNSPAKNSLSQVTAALKHNNLGALMHYQTPKKQLIMYHDGKPILNHAIVEKISFQRKMVHLVNTMFVPELMPNISTETKLLSTLKLPLNQSQLALLVKREQALLSSQNLLTNFQQNQQNVNNSNTPPKNQLDSNANQVTNQYYNSSVTLLKQRFQSLLVQTAGSLVNMSQKPSFSHRSNRIVPPTKLLENIVKNQQKKNNETKNSDIDSKNINTTSSDPNIDYSDMVLSSFPPHVSTAAVILSPNILQNFNDRAGVISTDPRQNVTRYATLYASTPNIIPFTYKKPYFIDNGDDNGQKATDYINPNDINNPAVYDELLNTLLFHNNTSGLPNRENSGFDGLTRNHEDNEYQSVLDYHYKINLHDLSSLPDTQKSNIITHVRDELPHFPAQNDKNDIIQHKSPTLLTDWLTSQFNDSQKQSETRSDTFGFVYNNMTNTMYSDLRVEPPVIAYPGFKLTTALDLDLTLLNSIALHQNMNDDHEFTQKYEKTIQNYAASASMLLRSPKETPQLSLFMNKTNTANNRSIANTFSTFPQERTIVEYITGITQNVPQLHHFNTTSNSSNNGVNTKQFTLEKTKKGAFIHNIKSISTDEIVSVDAGNTQIVHNYFIKQQPMLGSVGFMKNLSLLLSSVDDNNNGKRGYQENIMYDKNSRQLYLLNNHGNQSFTQILSKITTKIGQKQQIPTNLIFSSNSCQTTASVFPNAHGELQLTTAITPSLHYYHTGVLTSLQYLNTTLHHKLLSQQDQVNTHVTFAFHNLLQFFYSYHSLYIMNNPYEYNTLLEAVGIKQKNSTAQQGTNKRIKNVNDIKFIKTPIPSDIQLATLFLTKLHRKTSLSQSSNIDQDTSIHNDNIPAVDMRVMSDTLTHTVELDYYDLSSSSSSPPSHLPNPPISSLVSLIKHNVINFSNPHFIKAIPPLQRAKRYVDELDDTKRHSVDYSERNTDKDGEIIKSYASKRVLHITKDDPCGIHGEMEEYDRMYDQYRILKQKRDAMDDDGNSNDDLNNNDENGVKYIKLDKKQKEYKKIKKSLNINPIDYVPNLNDDESFERDDLVNNNVFELYSIQDITKHFFSSITRTNSPKDAFSTFYFFLELEHKVLCHYNKNLTNYFNNKLNDYSKSRRKHCDSPQNNDQYELSLKKQYSLLKRNAIVLLYQQLTSSMTQRYMLDYLLQPYYMSHLYSLLSSPYLDSNIKNLNKAKGQFMYQHLAKFGLLRGQYPGFTILHTKLKDSMDKNDGKISHQNIITHVNDKKTTNIDKFVDSLSNNNHNNSQNSDNSKQQLTNIRYANKISSVSDLIFPDYSLFIDLHGIDHRLQPALITLQFEQLYSIYCIQRLSQIAYISFDKNDNNDSTHDHYKHLDVFQGFPTSASLRSDYNNPSVNNEKYPSQSSPQTSPKPTHNIKNASKKDVLEQMLLQKQREKLQNQQQSHEKSSINCQSNWSPVKLADSEYTKILRDTIVGHTPNRLTHRHIPKIFSSIHPSNNNDNDASNFSISPTAAGLYSLPHVALSHALSHGIGIITGRLSHYKENISSVIESHSSSQHQKINNNNGAPIKSTPRLQLPVIISQYTKALLYPAPLVEKSGESNLNGLQCGVHYPSQHTLVRFPARGYNEDSNGNHNNNNEETSSKKYFVNNTIDYQDGRIFYQPNILLKWMETRFSADFPLFSQDDYDKMPSSLCFPLNNNDKNNENGINKQTIKKMENDTPNISITSIKSALLYHILHRLHDTYRQQFEDTTIHPPKTPLTLNEADNYSKIYQEELLLSAISSPKHINPTGTKITRTEVFDAIKDQCSPYIVDPMNNNRDKISTPDNFHVIITSSAVQQQNNNSNHNIPQNFHKSKNKVQKSSSYEDIMSQAESTHHVSLLQQNSLFLPGFPYPSLNMSDPSDSMPLYSFYTPKELLRDTLRIDGKRNNDENDGNNANNSRALDIEQWSDVELIKFTLDSLMGNNIDPITRAKVMYTGLSTHSD